MSRTGHFIREIQYGLGLPGGPAFRKGTSAPFGSYVSRVRRLVRVSLLKWPVGQTAIWNGPYSETLPNIGLRFIMHGAVSSFLALL